MITEIKEIKEFHENGTLNILENRAYIAPMFNDLFSNTRTDKDGRKWIRTGKQIKYFDNGQIGWTLSYDENGNIINEDSPSYRKDGTLIQY